MCTHFQTRNARVIELANNKTREGDVLVNPVACLVIGGRSPHTLRFPFPCPPSNGSARPLLTTALPASPSISHRTAPIPPPCKQRYEPLSRRSLHPTVLLRPSLVDIAVQLFINFSSSMPSIPHSWRSLRQSLPSDSADPTV